MPYRFIEEEATADIAFEAWDEELNNVFRDAANAVTNVMIANPESIDNKESIDIDLNHSELDLLLYNFLEQIIYYKDARRLLLQVNAVEIKQRDHQWHLHAVASGEPLDTDRHQQVVDVKAVTMHDFLLAKTGREWRAHVVLDI